MSQRKQSVITRETFHTRFGGLVKSTDFDTEHNQKSKNNSGSSIAGRIAGDFCFDHMCEQNLLAKKRQKQNTHEKDKPDKKNRTDKTDIPDKTDKIGNEEGTSNE